MGIALKALGQLDEAEASCRKAIALKPNLAQAHSNLGIILYESGDIDAALECIEKANSVDPKLKDNKLLLSVLKSRRSREKAKAGVGNITNLGYGRGLTSNPLILNRSVEPELIANLYKMNFRELDKIKDPNYGNARGSGYSLFEDDSSIIKIVAEDLISIIMEVVETDVFIHDFFLLFWVLGVG